MSPQYQVAPPQQQFVIMRAPAGPMPQQQFQQQARQPEQLNFQPRKKNIIQIKDLTDNRDITDEIMSSSKQSSGSFSGSTSTTPNVTPEVSGQSSNASTPPMNPPQMPEDVRAKFAAQVAATLEDGMAPSKPQEAPDVPQTETPVKKEESVQKEILRKPEKVEATTTESAQKVLESVENPKLKASPPPVGSAKEVLPIPEIVKPVAQRKAKGESVAWLTQVLKTADIVKPVEKEVTKSEPAVVEAIGEEGIVKTVSAFLRVTFCKRREVTNSAKKIFPSYFATINGFLFFQILSLNQNGCRRVATAKNCVFSTCWRGLMGKHRKRIIIWSAVELSFFYQ